MKAVLGIRVLNKDVIDTGVLDLDYYDNSIEDGTYIMDDNINILQELINHISQVENIKLKLFSLQYHNGYIVKIILEPK